MQSVCLCDCKLYEVNGRRLCKIQVLLADDHPVVRGGVRALLEEEADIEVVGEASVVTRPLNWSKLRRMAIFARHGNAGWSRRGSGAPAAGTHRLQEIVGAECLTIRNTLKFAEFGRGQLSG